ncbi:sulfotransferase domain-containing protein [Oscillatoria sp. CS-180]|uniref:sulfotransferase domain-containing protein n=1 Tax=Oscillatoria sp. CS-180 TaxID=3021720 RepID=UPI00232E76CE|nr:sulfotransferase domain-containing protein [Oscillatoria sp. CS-180]MDB9528359.1 sulfotransferase domain-containing protein [Oscillatoria sp. CS-180]
MSSSGHGLLDKATGNSLKFPVTEDDIFLVSYPKSGNTWVRNIIFNIIFPNESIQTLKEIDHFVPDLSRNSGLNALATGLYDQSPQPRVFKIHNSYPFRPGQQNKLAYRRVIYIVRHPFDVIRSYHHYFKRYNSDQYKLEDSINKVIFQGNQWGTWQDNVLTWKAHENNVDFLLIRYEDLLLKTVDFIEEIAAFLGHDIDRERAEIIRDHCSLESMRRLKNNRIADKDFKFVRESDSSRELKEQLTPELKSVISSQCGYAMKLFGYENQ